MMSPPGATKHARTWWGPVELNRSEESVEAQVPGSGRVAIHCPPPVEGFPHNVEAYRSLATGVSVSVDGQPWVTLRQPQRPLLFRRDRIILIEGDPDSVPPGSFLRARWMWGMGLESSTDLGAPRDVRWVRPRLRDPVRPSSRPQDVVPEPDRTVGRGGGSARPRHPPLTLPLRRLAH